ncbi:MAG: hypothetical protein ABIZ81_03015 [Opitutaceae bacterium]
MNFFRGLFPNPSIKDPTPDGPASTVVVPDVCFETPAIGQLRFGAPLGDARYLGKPDSVRTLRPGYVELLYAKAGFQLDFEDERLACVAFHIGPDSSQPRSDGLKYSSPWRRGGPRFSSATTRDDLIRELGEPESVDDSDLDEVIVNFFTNGLVLEFELNQTGVLKRWNIYPEEGVLP